ncbi:MAG: hypothetical protein AB1558_15435 [Thermodesulfobacteriota bacterium]
MRDFWDQLTRSQKNALTAGLVFAGAALLVQFALLPYLDSRQKVRTAIAANERALRELSALGAEYDVLRARSEQIRRSIEGRPPGFAFPAYLEKKADEAAVKKKIRSINPLKPSPAGLYEESAVEMKLDHLTMRQLSDFLYLLESPEEMVRIRKASVARMKESPEYLGLSIQIVTYQPLPAASR